MAVNVLTRSSFVVLFAGSLIATLIAQQPKKFDVTSVKPADPNIPGTSYRTEGGRFSGTITTETLLLLAIRDNDRAIRPEQIVGAPDWVRSDRFQITGVFTGDDRPPDRNALALQLPELMRSLLADRFKLATHREPRSLPVYALVLARRDGRLGPQLKAVTDCSPTVPPGPPRCGPMSSRPGAVSDKGVSLDALLAPLIVASGRMVINRTALTGRYDIDLKWAANPNTDTTDLTSIFTAVEEQLGLKLESTTDLVNVAVIDHIERPSPD